MLRVTRHTALRAVVLAVFGCMWLASAGGAAPTADITVSMEIGTSTTLDMSGCASGSAGTTSFGVLQPRDTIASTPQCEVVFGANIPNSSLRIAQTDAFGAAMFQHTLGALDASFDTDGRVATATGPGTNADIGRSLVPLADGRIIASGDCTMAGSGADVCVVRYNANGSLDTSFDTDGRATTPIAGGAGSDSGYEVLVQTDGKYVVVGTCDMGGLSTWNHCLARFNTNGSLDNTFDVDGLVSVDTGTNAVNAGYAGELQSDGGILVAGRCNMVGTGFDACVYRFDTNGGLDNTFDGDGRVTTAIAPGGNAEELRGIVVQPDGRIVVAGICDMGGTANDFCLARYNANGSFDNSFDVDGKVTTAFAAGAANDDAWYLALQNDGKLIAVGDCALGGATGTDFCVARYNSNGSLDPTFDVDGKVTTDVGPGAAVDRARGVSIQEDGKIVVNGDCDMAGTTGTDACLVRYNSDGSLDASFGTNGRVSTATGPTTANDQGRAVTVMPDGRIATIGRCDMVGTTGIDWCLARYAGATVGQYSYGSVDWNTDPDPGFFGMCLLDATGYTANITTNAACPMSDGPGPAYWHPITTTQTTLGTAAAPTNTALAEIRFGLKVAHDQPVGDYTAPVTFELLAP